MKIGLFGGSFNPIHNAHLQIIDAALREGGFDRLIVMPAGIPPHKAALSFDASHRYEMTRLACAGRPGVEVSDFEIKKPNPSYTIETVESLETQFPGAEITVVLGSDSVRSLTTWHRWRELASKVRFLIARRPGHDQGDTQALEAAQGHYGYLSGEFPDISSTKIRENLSDPHKLLQFMPSAAVSYLKSQGLCVKSDR